MARISDQLFGASPSALRGAEDDEAALLAELDAKASASRRPAPAATTATPSDDEAALLQELDAVAHQTRVTQTEGGKVSRFAKGAGSTLAKPEVMAATVERAGAGLGMAVSASDVAEYDTLSPEQQGRIKRELGGEDVSWTERLPFTDTHLPGNTGPAVRRFEGSMPGTPDAARAGAAAARLAEARIGQNAPGAQLADSYGGDAPVFDRVQRAQGAARLMGEDRSPLAVDMFEASAEKAAEVQETVLDPHRREMYQRYGEAGALGSGLIESVPSLAAGIGIGVATRNAAAGARVALPTAARLGAVTGAGSQGAMSAGTAYADAVDKGLNPELARVYALGYSAAELIPSAWSLDTILSAGGRNALTRMGIGAATEGAQESVTAVLQAAIDKGMVDPDMTFGEAWDRVWQGAMLGSMLGAPMGAISGIGADTENTEGRSSPGADAMTNGQPPLQNPPGLTADELLAVIQQNTGAPANAEPMSPEMDRQQKIEQARARAQTQRELTDTFTNSTDVLRRENVAVTDDGLEVPDAAAPAQDPLGRHADPRSDHYALTVLAKDLSDELGFQARPEDLDLIAQDIAKGTDPKRAVRDRMKAGEAFAIAQRRRERKASALGQDETNPENLRDFRAGAPTDYTGTDGEPLPTTITPRMQQEREAATADRAALNPQVNRGQPGMSPRNAVDRISTDAVSGLRGTHIPGQQPDFGPSSPMPRQGETFDATEFDQQERQRQNTQQGRGLPESVTLGRNQQELRPGFTDNTGDQAVAAHPGRPQDVAPVEQPTQPTQPERTIDRLRKRRADKRPAPQTPDVIVPETDGELPDLDLGPEPEARRPMSPDEERDMDIWAARQGLTNLIDDIPASSGMEAGVDALLNQGYSLDDITDVLETKLARARADAAAAGTDRAKRAPAEAEVARLQGVAHLLLQRDGNTAAPTATPETGGRPDFELTPDDQEQTPAVPEQEPTAGVDLTPIVLTRNTDGGYDRHVRVDEWAAKNIPDEQWNPSPERDGDGGVGVVITSPATTVTGYRGREVKVPEVAKVLFRTNDGRLVYLDETEDGIFQMQPVAPTDPRIQWRKGHGPEQAHATPTPAVPEQEPTAEQGPKLTAKQRLAAKKKANAEIEAAAAATNTAPTDAQKESGNYAKGKVSLHGLTISIENPKGSVRSGTDRSGKPWKTRMKDHYGYIKGTKGKDKDHVDVFIGPDPTSEQVFVVDQVNPKTGKFDEHKVILGARDEAEARTIYQRNYQRGWKGAGAVTAMSMADFKSWVSNRMATQLPAAERGQGRANAANRDILTKIGNGGGRTRVLATLPKPLIETTPAELEAFMRDGGYAGHRDSYLDEALRNHADAVHRALIDGVPVPDEVLGDLPYFVRPELTDDQIDQMLTDLPAELHPAAMGAKRAQFYRAWTPANPAVLSSDQATDQETETDGNPGTLQRETDTDTAADDNGAGAGAVRSVASRRQESGEPIPRADERDANILIDVYAGDEEVGRIPIGIETVETAEDALHVLSFLRRRAQENVVLLGLDENKRPVAVFRHSIGARAASQIDYLSLVGPVLRNQKVASVWMGHNHPSGRRDHSSADNAVLNELLTIFTASGVDVEGSVVVGSIAGKGSTMSPDMKMRDADPRPAPRNKGAVSLVERVLRRVTPGRFADVWMIDGVDTAKRAIARLGDGKPGVLLLSHQHAPVAFVPLQVATMAGALRDGGRDSAFAALVREAEKRNATRAIAYFGESPLPDRNARLAARNIGAALAHVEVEVFDVIGSIEGYSDSKPISFVQYGLHSGSPSRSVFLSKANTLSSKPARGMATDAVRRLADKFVADLSGALGVKIEVLAKQTDHPQLAQLAENGETVRAGYNPRTKTVTLVAENLANAEAVFAALRHEILGHHGLRSVLSDADYKQVIDAILATKGKSKGLDAVWETVDANYGDAGDIIRAEEVFTHVAEQGLTNLGAAWAKVKAAVLQALRKIGLLPKTQISEAEVQALIQSIAQGMKQGVGRDDGPGSPGGDLRFSKSSNNPNRRDLTADEKIGQPAPAAPKSFVDQLEDLGTRLLSGQLSQAAQVAETEILDRFLPAKALEAKMRKFGKDITAATSAYVSMRMSTSVGSVVEAMLRFGAPQWRGGVIQHKPGTIGLLDAFGKLGSDTALNDWLAWMAAHRAEELMRSGRESNLDRNDIRELKARVGDRAALFEEVRKDYNAIKSAVLDLQQSVGLIDPDSRAQWESNWYVPFYRADESVLELDITGREDVKGKSSKLKTLRNKNRLSNQDSVIKALKGSELPTRDLLSNIMANLSGGIDAAMKQDAMVKLVRNLSDAEVGVMSRLGFENQVSAAQRNADGVFYVRERGRKVYYHVDTTQFDGQELYHTIAELGWLRTNDGAMGATLRLGRMFKRVLTRGITATPPFIVRNMLRDSVSAWMISPDHFRLGVDTARGIKESLKQGEYARAMAFAGATFQGGFLSDTDPDAVRNEIKRMLAAQGMAQEEAAAFAGSVVLTPAHMKRLAKLMLAGPHLALSKWLTFGERMENANRIAVYMRALENGRSAADAAYEGKDLMDYSLMGRSNVIKFLSDISPFMNARIQGNYKTVRSLANRHTLARGLMVAGATLLLAAMNAGEDWYERLPDWERDTYWHIKAGDELFRIAKPFELGVMFATVPERLGRLALNESGIAPNDETGKTVLASLGWNLWNTSQIFTMPSPVSAVWQLGTNTNSFTKLPIETQADRSVSKSQRYGEHTSVTLVAAGDELEAMGLSPKQAEHLVGAIFGTVGNYALAAADGITRRVTDAPEKPEARAHESRVPGLDMLGVFYRGNANDVPVRTKHEDEFYKMLKETGQVYATFDKLAREGQAEKARELLAERPGAIQMAQSLAKTGMALRKLQDAQAAIVKDPKMTATEKRRRIDKIRAARQAITKQQVEAARPLLDKDE